MIRIIVIFGILGALFSTVLSEIYMGIGVNLSNSGWWSSFGILLLIFVLYRNKIQFSGWYNGKGKVKLSNKVTILLVSSSIIMILIPGINELIHSL
ncbi:MULTISPECIES: hypothetical protein [unclassified Bacillus (in: firmicutes)]|uniref:hypothetical protein n=1 Tax=unclassified Bacillus (in: firmicutes) TaxID=185979 RepID=UPI00256FD49B|nr:MULTISPECIES: hypothetical protein [unclassified Bacillus (in: firmicutes)]